MKKGCYLKSRDDFVHLIQSYGEVDILEIGPLNRPMLLGPKISYFDLLPTQLLREKSIREGLDPSGVPEINFWNEVGDLRVISRDFFGVVSAHCIEHQPDLINHLSQVENLLRTDGRYFVVMPDHRYCFDHFIAPSKLTEIVRANRESRRVPDLYSVIEHRALTCHNDPVLHWNEKSGVALVDLKRRWQLAEDEFNSAAGRYIDVHVWQFSPESFRDILNGLFILGLTNFEVEELFPTPENDLEFFCVLRKTRSGSQY